MKKRDYYKKTRLNNANAHWLGVVEDAVIEHELAFIGETVVRPTSSTSLEVATVSEIDEVGYRHSVRFEFKSETLVTKGTVDSTYGKIMRTKIQARSEEAVENQIRVFAWMIGEFSQSRLTVIET